jgi:hypothetical protein
MPLYYPKLCPEAVTNHDRCHLGLEKNAEYLNKDAAITLLWFFITTVVQRHVGMYASNSRTNGRLALCP